MKIFFDTEFYDDGEEAHLLSIGLVREDGETYYAEIQDAPWDLAGQDEWLQENVISNMSGPQKPREQVAREIIKFVGDYPEFWAYYADWDWVLLIRLCSLTGKLLDSPPSWPHFCMDLKQLSKHLNNLRLPAHTGTQHNALDDAEWVKSSYEYAIDKARMMAQNLQLGWGAREAW